MEFTVEFFDYGRHGVTVKEPRTGLCGWGQTRDEARDDLAEQLRHHIENDYVSPSDEPLRSIETLRV